MSTIQFRPARPSDIAACIALRGRTRQNAVSAQRLAELGITVESWGGDVAAGHLPGMLACDGERLAGYGFGDARSGEVVVLALLPDYEGQGLGRQLLERTMVLLREAGHARLFLGCSDDPASRSHGFYRRLGWRPTGRRDHFGDEELEFLYPAPAPSPTERLVAYLQAYEAMDLERIAAQLADEVALTDWNLAVQGREAVLAETRRNFEATRSLQIRILASYEGPERAAAELEILVDGDKRLHVVDALQFDAAGRISAIRAYLGL